MSTTSNSALANGHQPAKDDTLESSTEAGLESSTEAGLESSTEEPTIGAVDDKDAAAVTEKSVEVPTEQESRSRRKLVVKVLAVLLVIGVLVGAGYGGWLFYQQQRLEGAARDAQHAAEKYAVILTSIDTGAIDQNFRDVLDGSTGEFKDMYSKSSTQLRQLLLDNKAAAHGTVLESAVQSTTPDRVVVLLFVDQSITNSQVPDPRIDRSRIKMTMDNVDGRWLASKVELP